MWITHALPPVNQSALSSHNDKLFAVATKSACQHMYQLLSTSRFFPDKADELALEILEFATGTRPFHTNPIIDHTEAISAGIYANRIDKCLGKNAGLVDPNLEKFLILARDGFRELVENTPETLPNPLAPIHDLGLGMAVVERTRNPDWDDAVSTLQGNLKTGGERVFEGFFLAQIGKDMGKWLQEHKGDRLTKDRRTKVYNQIRSASPT